MVGRLDVWMFGCLDVWTFGGWEVGRLGGLGVGRRVTLSLAKGLSHISWIDGSRGSRFAVLRMTGGRGEFSVKG